jgi:hypothetical protein
MPRPNRETKADRAIAMLEQGMKPPDIAAELGCSANYVRVCRTRANLEKQGIRRSTLTPSGYAKVMTPEEREAMYVEIGKKVRKTMAFKRRQRYAGQMSAKARAERLAHHEAMRSSSIPSRREHVNRILQAWKETA